MSKGLEFAGRVENGRLPKAVGERIAAAIRQGEGKHVVVTVKERTKARSGQANRYYWSCVVGAITAMFRDAGNVVSPDDVHDFLKLHVGKLRRVIVTPQGEVMQTLRSTADLTPKEFSDYIESIRAWAAELWCDIPDANQFHNQGAHHDQK